jgi:hypothetical protein
MLTTEHKEAIAIVAAILLPPLLLPLKHVTSMYVFLTSVMYMQVGPDILLITINM